MCYAISASFEDKCKKGSNCMYSHEKRSSISFNKPQIEAPCLKSSPLHFFYRENSSETSLSNPKVQYKKIGVI